MKGSIPTLPVRSAIYDITFLHSFLRLNSMKSAIGSIKNNHPGTSTVLNTKCRFQKIIYRTVVRKILHVSLAVNAVECFFSVRRYYLSRVIFMTCSGHNKRSLPSKLVAAANSTSTAILQQRLFILSS